MAAENPVFKVCFISQSMNQCTIVNDTLGIHDSVLVLNHVHRRVHLPHHGLLFVSPAIPVHKVEFPYYLDLLRYVIEPYFEGHEELLVGSFSTLSAPVLYQCKYMHLWSVLCMFASSQLFLQTVPFQQPVLSV